MAAIEQVYSPKADDK